mmetsp:Transcript_78006/g.198222  ORF Transcript_78006/g.198222 Transcript_78006/m.198222 type:complete len:221 (-) Transcript_78006:744-1406(-)
MPSRSSASRTKQSRPMVFGGSSENPCCSPEAWRHFGRRRLSNADTVAPSTLRNLLTNGSTSLFSRRSDALMMLSVAQVPCKRPPDVEITIGGLPLLLLVLNLNSLLEVSQEMVQPPGKVRTLPGANHTLSYMLQELPNLQLPIRDMAEPRREKHRRDKDAPSETKPSTDIEEAKLVLLRMDKEEPRMTLSRTAIVAPKRTIPRSDNEEPHGVASRKESGL